MQRTERVGHTDNWWEEVDKYYTLLFKPTEIRDIDRAETLRYPDGRLKPIINNWEKLKNYAIRFIDESI